MGDEPVVIATRWAISLIIVGGISSFTAYRKGYTPGWWLFACGCVGLLVIAFLPNTKDPYMTRERKTALRRRGNLVGICFTSLAVVLNVILLIKALGSK